MLPGAGNRRGHLDVVTDITCIAAEAIDVSIRQPLILMVPLVLGIAACSGGGATTVPSVPPATEVPNEAPSAAAATVALADHELGRILVDGAGRTLYGFTADVDGVSTCYDQCAVKWPPLLSDGAPTVGEGLDASMLTTVERSDGSAQLKYGDWPLYHWAADTAPGDATGQGVGGVWFVIGADGKLIGAPSAEGGPDGY